MSTLIRLSKRMSELGLCSRREADKLIEQGLVLVNGEAVSQLGFKVSESDKIVLTKTAENILQQKITLILNKPLGYVSSQPEDGYETALKLITKNNRIAGASDKNLKLNLKNLAPAGRLDINSKGLIIYTQDGVVAKQIIGESSKVDKEYLVKFKGQMTQEKLSLLSHGLKLDDKPLKRACVEVIDKNTIKLILQEGKKRQIRRMLKLIDLETTELKRLRIGPIELGELKPEQWRVLTRSETQKLIKYSFKKDLFNK